MERINQICNGFSSWLERCRERNHEDRPFYPDGTATNVFRMDEESLHELFRLLLSDHGSAAAVPELVHRVMRSLTTILAVILRSRPPNDIRILEQFIDLLISDDGFYEPPRLIDDNLPIPLTEAQFFFPQNANDFFDVQFQFCAIILRREEHLVYQDNYRSRCPLPYKKQERIGGGAYGQVYKVNIERRHFRSTGDSTGNLDPVWLARKDFKKHQAFSFELDVLKKIMAQPQKHDHLVMVLAILQYGDTNSLFFHLASGDLHQYLNNEIPPGQSAPVTLDQKKAIFSRGVALAGALAFLHGGFDGTACLHLDLKPRNILVYEAYNPEREIWKITDFGLTRVRSREQSSVALGFEGTYLAPECVMPDGKVSAESDVWSLGCIFSLVITYMLYGSRGVRTFAERRGEQAEGDSFYVKTKNSTPRISPAVTSWFDDIKRSTILDERESRVVRESLEYLQSKVLHPIRRQRARAKDVETALQNIQAHFTQAALEYAPGPPTPPKPDSIFKRLLGRIRDRRPKPSPSRLLPFGYDLGPNKCGFRFSPQEGDFLTFFSTDRMLIWTVSEILSTPSNRAQIPQPQLVQVSDWPIKCFAISSQSICSCLDADSFLCYIYNIEGRSSAVRVQEGLKVSYDHMGSIKKVTMSLDGALAAFVITDRPKGSESDCRIYLTYIEDLMGTADGENNYAVARSSRSNSVSEGSSISVTTAANLITDKADIKSAAQVRFLEFTPDGKFLVIVSQKGLGNFSIRAWETYSGKCYRDLTVTIETPPALPALFSGCCLFISKNAEPCLAILVYNQRIIHVNLFKGTFSDRLLRINVHSMFVCDDGSTLVLVGKNRGLRAYLLPLHALDKSNFIRVAKINGLSYAPAIDDAIVRRYDTGQLKLLIASSSGSFCDMTIYH